MTIRLKEIITVASIGLIRKPVTLFFFYSFNICHFINIDINKHVLKLFLCTLCDYFIKSVLLPNSKGNDTVLLILTLRYKEKIQIEEL